MDVTPEEDKHANPNVIVGPVVVALIGANTAPIRSLVTRMTLISGTKRAEAKKIAEQTNERQHHHLKGIKITIITIFFIICYQYYLHLMMIMYCI